MPSKSEKQLKFMRYVKACKDHEDLKCPRSIKKIADRMTDDQLDDFLTLEEETSPGMGPVVAPTADTPGSGDVFANPKKKRVRLFTYNDFIDSKNDEIKESKSEVDDIVDMLSDIDYKVREKLKVLDDISDITESNKLQEEYIKNMKERIEKLDSLVKSISKEIFNELEKRNSHLLNNFLVLSGYLDIPNEYSKYETLFKKHPKLFLNPEFF